MSLQVLEKEYAVSGHCPVRRLFLPFGKRFGYLTSDLKDRWPISAPVSLKSFKADLKVLLVVFDESARRAIRVKPIRRLFSFYRATWVSYFQD